MEKLALALVITARKLRSYFQSHRVVVLTNYLLKHVMSRPEASGRLIKWAVTLGQYDMDYQPRTAQKAQVLADFVMELSSNPKSPLVAEEQTSKWMLHVDGASNANNGGADILIQGPKGVEIEVAARLSFPVTNNEAEYEALILGLKLAYNAGARDLEVFTDSQTENDKADALSKFGAAMDGIRDRKITALVRERSTLSNKAEVQMVSEAKSWKDKIVKYLEDGTLLADPIVARRVKFRATRFTMLSEDNSIGILLAHASKRFQRAGEEVRKLPEMCIPDTPTCDPDRADQDSLPVRPGRKITEWCKELKIAQHFTAVVNPQANGQTEVTNKTILQHLKTRLENKGSWVDELPGVLWAYRTTPRTATGETLFCLGGRRGVSKRTFDLTVIEEKRDAAYARILRHKGLMMKSHDQKIRPRQLQVGDLVLKKVEAYKHVGKLEQPWEGPYKATRYAGTKPAAPMEHKELEEVLRVNPGVQIMEPVKGCQLRQDRTLGACERPSTMTRSRLRSL
ncbi:UNVERIFIED_CONTAM: hypothetical protein Sindi_1994300 [Sesamum indicum]